jgi:hypothetical protein
VEQSQAYVLYPPALPYAYHVLMDLVRPFTMAGVYILIQKRYLFRSPFPKIIIFPLLRHIVFRPLLCYFVLHSPPPPILCYFTLASHFLFSIILPSFFSYISPFSTFSSPALNVSSLRFFKNVINVVLLHHLRICLSCTNAYQKILKQGNNDLYWQFEKIIIF